MEKSLRQRLRKIKINCCPWSYWKGEIRLLPLSAQTLFAKYGLPIDVLEKALKEEGWLFPEEILLEVLKTELYRKSLQKIGSEEDKNFGQIPEDWDEEDYLDYFGDKNV